MGQEVAQKARPNFIIKGAALSIVTTGALLNVPVHLPALATVYVVTIVVGVLIYDFNDLIDENAFSQTIGEMLKYTQVWRGLMVSLLLLGLSFFVLAPAQLFACLALLGVGLLYSHPFNWSIKQKTWRLKDIYLLKNILIGLGWGLLTIIGSGNFSKREMIYFFLFVSLQVLMGSVMRDIDDIAEDQKNGVRSLPVVHGLSKTVSILQWMNWIGGGAIIAMAGITLRHPAFFFLLIAVLVWRAFLLFQVKNSAASKTWLLQSGNIGTCIGIFLLKLIAYMV